MRLTEYYRTVYAPLKLRSRSNRTRELYEITLRHFAAFLGREPALTDFADDTVCAYLAWFLQRGRSPASVNKERNNLLAMWRFAARKRLVEQWPDVEPEVEPERIPQAWTDVDVASLIRTIKLLPGRVGNVLACLWWLALVMVCWDTGERIGAVLGLRWKDINLNTGFVVCRAETRKGRRKDRLYRFAADTVLAVHAVRPQRWASEDLVFAWPYSRTYLWNRLGLILAKAGLPADGKSKFHRIRRTVASYAEAKSPGSATELLGHSRRSVTLAYIDPRIVERRYATDLLFRPGDLLA